MNTKLIGAAVLAGALTSLNAAATTATCVGPVTEVGVHRPDGLYVRLSTTHILKYCAFSAANTYNDITPEGCRYFATVASQAKASGAWVVVTIDNAPSTDCLQMPDWAAADVRYLGAR